MRFTLVLLLSVLLSNFTFSQSYTALYSQNNNKLTNYWTGNGSFSEEQNNTSTINNFNFIFDYTVSGYWAGVNFSLNNWGSGPNIDFGAYDSIIVSYKGLQSGNFKLTVEDGGGTMSGNQIMTPQTSWTTIAFPISGFTSGSAININNIAQLRFSSEGVASGMGQLEVAQLVLKKNPTGTPPTVSITSPTSGASQTTKNTISVTANASDAGGSIDKVNFYANGQLITSDATSPFSFEYFPQYNGNITFEAIAIDNDGNEVKSSSVAYSINYSGDYHITSETLYNKMGKGINMTNWLDAYWDMGIAGFPDETKYPENFLDTLQKLGINTVRLPVVFERFSNDIYPHALNTPHEIFDLVDSLIEWTDKRDMILIIDNHHPQTILTESNIEAAAIRTARVMRQVIEKYEYADSSRVFFELRNEPKTISAEPLRLFMQSVIDTVRSINTSHTIMLGGSGFNDAYNVYRYGTYNDTNILYTYHDYNPYNFTHQGFSWAGPPPPPTGTTFASVIGDFSASVGYFEKLSNWSDSLNAHVVLGEFGASVYADETSRCDYTDTMRTLAESYQMPWIYWGWMSAKVADESFGWFNSASVEMDSIIPCMYTALDFDTTGYAPLPVTWLSLTAKAEGQTALLHWEVASELNNSHYEVERRVGDSWEYIGYVQGGGNSSETKSYFFVDAQPNAVNFYRITQVDFDGKVSYSPTAKLVFENNSGISIYPNPSAGTFYIDTENAIDEVAITDVSGRAMDVILENNKVQIESYEPGIYLYQIKTAIGSFNGKIVLE